MGNTARQVIESEIRAEIDRLEAIQTESIAESLLLWEWGRWSHGALRDLGYPPCLLRFVAHGWKERSLRRIVASIDDADAVRIDAAVASLPFCHRKVVITIYQWQVETRRLPETLGWSRHRIDQLHNQALGMLQVLLQGR
jgi:hypothetical protein